MKLLTSQQQDVIHTQYQVRLDTIKRAIVRVCNRHTQTGIYHLSVFFYPEKVGVRVFSTQSGLPWLEENVNFQVVCKHISNKCCVQIHQELHDLFPGCGVDIKSKGAIPRTIKVTLDSQQRNTLLRAFNENT